MRTSLGFICGFMSTRRDGTTSAWRISSMICFRRKRTLSLSPHSNSGATIVAPYCNVTQFGCINCHLCYRHQVCLSCILRTSASRREMEDVMENGIRLLSEGATARMLAVSCAALRRWRRERRGPEFIRCGRCIRYDLRSLEEFLKENSSTTVTKVAADSRSAAQGEVRFAHASTRG